MIKKFLKNLKMPKKVSFGFLLLIIIVGLGITALVLVNSVKKSGSEKVPEVELKPIDETWNLYTNHKLGFSMKIPKEVDSETGACEWDNQKDSYVNKFSIVPLKTIETNEGIDITPAYSYDLLEQQGDAYKFLDCKKKYPSLDNLGTESLITVKSVYNDKEIDDFIKSQMKKIDGNYCGMNKTPAKQNGVYDIEIKGDDKELGESSCGINVAYMLKYYPTKNKIAYWLLGQEAHFFKDFQNLDSYDEEMADSFEFIE